MQHLLILLIYTVFQRYILSFTATPLEEYKKERKSSVFFFFFFPPQNRKVFIYSWQPVAGCFLVGMWEKKELLLKENLDRISGTLNNNGFINYAPLGPLCASLTGWRQWLLPLHQCGRTAWSSGLPIDWDWHSGSGWLPPWGQYWHAGSGLDNRVAGLRLSSFD